MPFHTLFFLFFYLPAVLAAFFLCPKRGQNALLLAASLLFYFWGAPTFLGWVVLIAYIDFVLSHWLHRIPDDQPGKRKAILISAIFFNLSFLFYFKYANFAVVQFRQGLEIFGMQSGFIWENVILPMGISFITFEEISYLVDVFRKTSPPAKKFSEYLLFLLLFPHSVAGPIFRWWQMQPQIAAREVNPSKILHGLLRFSLGLGKKVLIADQLSPLADQIFLAGQLSIWPSQAWIGLLAFTLQIYFDFSGYSDMAIGLGRVFGFEFKENFNFPYLATSIGDFWKRWHISLTSWFRDYLYIPLGGSRKGTGRAAFNIALVFLLSGLWHGAAWHFVAWGLFHGILLGVEKGLGTLAGWRALSFPRPVKVLFVFLLAMVGWVFFRAESLPHATRYLKNLAGLGNGAGGAALEYALFFSFSPLTKSVLIAALLLIWAPLFPSVTFEWKASEHRSLRAEVLNWATSLALIALAMMRIVDSKFHPFLYFTF